MVGGEIGLDWQPVFVKQLKGTREFLFVYILSLALFPPWPQSSVQLSLQARNRYCLAL